MQVVRNASFAQLQQINRMIVGQSAFSVFIFGMPRLERNKLHSLIILGLTIDGDFQPETPGVLLSRGRFDPNVELVIGYSSAEGLLFEPKRLCHKHALQMKCAMRILFLEIRIGYVVTVLNFLHG